MLFLSRVILLAVLPAMILAAPNAAASGENWDTDLAAALEKGVKENKPVLADFSGSDWCKWCIKLDEEVFSQDAFKKFAADSLIPCVIDFPRDKSLIPADQAAKNKEYAAKYGVSGYPTVLLLEPDGSVFLKTGYREDGAGEYVKFLSSILELRAKVLELEKKPEPGTATALLDEIPEDALILRARLILGSFPEDDIAHRAEAAYSMVKVQQDQDGKHRKYLEEVKDKDPKGYFHRVTLAETFQDALKAYQKVGGGGGTDEDKAAAKAGAEKLVKATTVAEPYLTVENDKEERQMCFVFRALAYRMLEDQAGVDAAWKMAVEVDPEAPVLSSQAKQIIRPTE